MSEFSTRKRILVGKLESTPGTAETLADSDFDVRIEAPDLNPEYAFEAVNYAAGDYQKGYGVAGLRPSTIPFQTKFVESGTPATVEPNFWKMLKACGMVAKTYTTTGVALQDTAEGDLNTMTFEQYDILRGSTPTAKRGTVAGAMGTFSISAPDNSAPVMVEYTFNGKYQGQDDVSNANILALTSPDTTVAETLRSSTLTIGGVTFCVQSFNFTKGNTINATECNNDATGIKYHSIDGTDTTFQCVVLADDVATYDPASKFEGNTVETGSFAIGGNTTIHMPQMQLTPWTQVDVNGKVGYSLTFSLLRNSGTDSDIADDASFEILQGARA